MHERLKIIGVGRDPDNNRALYVSCNRRPTDDELRRLHDMLRSGIADVECVGGYVSMPTPGVKSDVRH